MIFYFANVVQDLDAAEVEEHHLPLNTGDNLQTPSENSIQQSASGTSTSDTSTIQSPSREIQELKSTEARVSNSGNTKSHNSAQSSTNTSTVQPSTTSSLSNSNNLNQKTVSGSSTSTSADFGSPKSDGKLENPERR